MKTRKQKAAGLLGRCFLAGAGIVGLAIGSGCESASDGELTFFSLLSGLASVNPDLTSQGRAGAGIIRGETNTERQRRNNIEAAREGRTEVNVYGGQNQNYIFGPDGEIIPVYYWDKENKTDPYIIGLEGEAVFIY